MKPKFFCASSGESKSFAENLKDKINEFCEVDLWTENFFGKHDFPIDTLIEKRNQYDGGIFLFFEDDKVISRKKRYFSARDNVILEYGIFLSAIGRKNCLIIHPPNIKIPSDIKGLYTLELKLKRGTKDIDLDSIAKEISDFIKDKTGKLNGDWIQNWVVNKFFIPFNNKSNVDVIHLGNHFRAQFNSLETEYEAFGEINKHYITGIWYTTNNHLGYHGSFQLGINGTNNELKGKWNGYSSTRAIIRSGKWTWHRR
ncbi:nucleotide-binding protein [Leptospira yasudae]|uniref:TIR domain-containing protein n=1 Tax=Leptospira yasudae TaxID=2202201 RepID=UPI001C4ED17B|nr:TIR domain-containing protein [Leptospira yasudae]MBW0436025.1 nucleotide-binding protein [Leptospira yasudae]